MRLPGKSNCRAEIRECPFGERATNAAVKMRSGSRPQEMAARQAPLQALRVINRSGTVVYTASVAFAAWAVFYGCCLIFKEWFFV